MECPKNAKLIPLTQGKFAIVDEEDYEWLNHWSWSIVHNKKKKRTTGIHARDKKTQKTILMHRLIMNAPKGTQVDHINRNIFDNRKVNLRLCANSENQQNKCKKKGKSKYKGVSPKGSKWRACIQYHTKQIHLGIFDNEEDAAIAYNRKAKELYGEKGYSNKLNESLFAVPVFY